MDSRTSRGIALLPQSSYEKITSLNVAGARSEGRVEGLDREGFHVTKLYTTRLHFNFRSARARAKAAAEVQREFREHRSHPIIPLHVIG